MAAINQTDDTSLDPFSFKPRIRVSARNLAHFFTVIASLGLLLRFQPVWKTDLESCVCNKNPERKNRPALRGSSPPVTYLIDCTVQNHAFARFMRPAESEGA
jgi:hypothetical protein